jgi:hypothetical protein
VCLPTLVLVREVMTERFWSAASSPGRVCASHSETTATSGMATGNLRRHPMLVEYYHLKYGKDVRQQSTADCSYPFQAGGQIKPSQRSKIL